MTTPPMTQDGNRVHHSNCTLVHRPNCIGHDCTAHDCTAHDCTAHDCTDHDGTGHDCTCLWPEL